MVYRESRRGVGITVVPTTMTVVWGPPWGLLISVGVFFFLALTKTRGPIATAFFWTFLVKGLIDYIYAITALFDAFGLFYHVALFLIISFVMCVHYLAEKVTELSERIEQLEAREAKHGGSVRRDRSPAPPASDRRQTQPSVRG